MFKTIRHFFRHYWSEWRPYIKESTLLEEVRQQRRCSVCGKIEDEWIAYGRLLEWTK